MLRCLFENSHCSIIPHSNWWSDIFCNMGLRIKSSIESFASLKPSANLISFSSCFSLFVELIDFYLVFWEAWCEARQLRRGIAWIMDFFVGFCYCSLSIRTRLHVELCRDVWHWIRRRLARNMESSLLWQRKLINISIACLLICAASIRLFFTLSVFLVFFWSFFLSFFSFLL